MFIFFYVIYILQILSIITTKWDASYKFLINLLDHTVIKAAFSVYTKESLLILVILTLVCTLTYRIIVRIQIKNNYLKSIIFYISLIYLLCPYSSIIRFISASLKYFVNPVYNLTQEELFKEISSKNFVSKENIKAEIKGKPKNLVIIFLESLEQNMLYQEPFKELTKNLQNIAEEDEFFKNIIQTEFSDWTMAGIHTVLCGNIFAYHSANVFRHKKISNFVCLFVGCIEDYRLLYG